MAALHRYQTRIVKIEVPEFALNGQPAAQVPLSAKFMQVAEEMIGSERRFHELEEENRMLRASALHVQQVAFRMLGRVGEALMRKVFDAWLRTKDSIVMARELGRLEEEHRTTLAALKNESEARFMVVEEEMFGKERRIRAIEETNRTLRASVSHLQEVAFKMWGRRWEASMCKIFYGWRYVRDVAEMERRLERLVREHEVKVQELLDELKEKELLLEQLESRLVKACVFARGRMRADAF